ncbi:MAG: VCBS repeat-containing protein [Acidobacteria bacterium]|nr:VCBS repeat-containing protein [Acidobacteriota bacterium]
MKFQIIIRLSLFISFVTAVSVLALTNRTTADFRPIPAAPANGELDPTFNAPVATVANLTVDAIAAQPDGKVLVGGKLGVGGDTPHNGIVRLDAQGNVDPTFNGGTGTGSDTQEVLAIAVQPDGKILAGGNFSQFNGQTIPSLVRLNSDGSLDTGFTVGTGTAGEVRSIAVQPDGKILVAGDFFRINGTSINRIARLNPNGTVDPTFTIEGTGPNFSVYAVRYQSTGKVLIGGMFTSYNNNSALSYFIRLNADGTVDNTFNRGTGVSFRVFTVAVDANDAILIGGFFSSYNGTARSNLARLNADGSLDPGFNPIVSNDVYSAAFQPDGKVLVGGNFNQVNGNSRGSLARINADGSLDQSFAAGVSFKVNSIFLQPDGKLLAGGEFSAANGVPRGGIARFDAAGGLDGSFDPVIGSAGTVQTISIYNDGKTLIGGFFNSVGSVRRNQLARLNADGTADPSFDAGAGANNSILTTAAQPDGKILVGGDFTQFNNVSQSSIVRLNPNGAIDGSFNLPGGISSRVRVIRLQPDGKILVGGGFAAVGGTARSRLARLNPDGSLDTGFSGEADGDVYDILPQPDGKIVIGGAFSRVNNTGGQIGIARLNPDGTLDTGFNSGAGVGGQVFSIVRQPDGKILIGGFFSAVDNLSRNYIARLNPNGSLDTSFDPGTGAGFTVFSLFLQPDGKIVAGGDFAVFNGSLHRGLVRLFENGAVDESFNPIIARAGYIGPTILKIDGYRATGQPAAGKLLIGGRLTSVNGSSRIGLARLNLNFDFSRTPFDFDGDRKTDISVFRPGSGEWWINRSSTGQTVAAGFGNATDRLVPGDFTGDGRTDLAVWRPGSGQWFVLRSEDGSYFSFPFGATGDVPVPADYDGDGRTDAAVFRPSNNTWFILKSLTGETAIVSFGASGDKPVPADYDGDGRTDLAIFRPSDGSWWFVRSSDNQVRVYSFGTTGDLPVPGDFTGDRKADIAVFRPSTGVWFVQRSEDGSYFSFPFGATGDAPVAGDYDGDGRFDPAVFRPSTSTWYVNRTTAGLLIATFGATGDAPVPNVFVP